MLTASDREVADWKSEIDTISSNHTQVAGVLAGFSATIVVLIISLGFGDTITLDGNLLAEFSLGSFTMAFFGYVATGILYSISIEKYKDHRYFLFSISGIVYYFSGVLGFSTVYPLVRLTESDALHFSVFIMVTGGLIGSFIAASIPLYDLLLVKVSSLVITFSISIVIGITFYLVIPLEITALVFVLLSICAVILVGAFNLAVLTFFFPMRNKGKFYRISSLVLIALATVTLCLMIGVGASAGM